MRIIGLIVFLSHLVSFSLQLCRLEKSPYSTINNWWTDESIDAIISKQWDYCYGLTSVSQLNSEITCTINYYNCSLLVQNSYIKFLTEIQVMYSWDLTGVKFTDSSIETISKDAFRSLRDLKEFSMQQNNITSQLPDELFSANVNLTAVDLSHNNIESVSVSTFLSSSIRYLNLSCNRFETIDFVWPKSLVNLDLSFNHILHIEENSFSRLTQLRTLKLNNNVLQSIPSGLFITNNNLKYLDLSHNNISSIGKTALFLQHIEYLNLQHNNLPLQLCEVLLPPSSKTLNLGFSSIACVSNGSFSGLTLLETLKLNNNSLGRLPETIFKQLESLKEINLQRNNVSSLPKLLFASNNKLLKINLADNKIFSVEYTAFFSESIRSLVLANNDIEKLNFTLPTTLEHLDLCSNRIDDIQDGTFFQTTNLNVLILSQIV